MVETKAEDVPGTPDEPTPEQILAQMDSCEPYTVSDLEDKYADTSRWTIQRRLDTLVDDGELRKKKHTETRVSYWVDRPQF